MRLSSLAAGGLPRLEEPCSRAAELPFAVLWLFSKFRTFGTVVRDDADNRGRLQKLLLSVLEQLPKSFQEAPIRLRTVVRSEGRRVGKEGVGQCRSRRSRYH